MISKETIDKIFNTAQIVDVVNDFVPLKKRGANYIACCPFHDEKTPSFSVSPAKGIFKCFGCGKGGNVVHFVMEHEHLGYFEALKYLGKRYNIEIEEREETPEEAQKRLRSDSLFAVNQFASQFFQNALNHSQEGRDIGRAYFIERQFSPEIIEKFRLGWAPSSRGALSNDALSKGYSKEYLVDVGLSLKDDQSGDLRDRFYDRVIFPIHSISGKVIAFGGRTLKKTKELAKYINSPESDIYSKSNSLYGIFQAKNAIVKEQKCYLVEGYTDVLSFHQANIENCVASSGTSLTVGQTRMIRRFSTNVTIVYDSDFAGIKASLRGLGILLEEGLNVRAILLPEGEDPDSFIKKNRFDNIKGKLEEIEVDFIELYLRLFQNEGGNDPLKRSEMIREVIASIAKIPDAISRTTYLKEASRKLEVEENLLIDEVATLLKKRDSTPFHRRVANHEVSGVKEQSQKEQKEGKIPTFITETYYEPAEREILYYLLKFGHLYLSKEDGVKVSNYILDQLQNDELELTNLIHKEIFNLYFSNSEKESEEIHKLLFNHPNAQIVKVVSDLLLDRHTLSVKVFVESMTPEEHQLLDVVPKSIAIYKAKITSIAYQKLCQKLEEAENSNDETLKTSVMEQLQILMRVRNLFSKELNRITI